MANWFRSLLRKKSNQALMQQQPGKHRISLAEIALTGGGLRIRDVSNVQWFPPGQPINPVSPPGTPPRRFAYTPLTNINWSSRDGQIDFATLRRFSNYTLVRAIIESVLDRLCSETWDFRLIAQDNQTKADYKKRNASDPRIKALKQFFKKPDGWQNFRTWTRGLYDDMLVIDAASIWLQRDSTGAIASLVQIDGSQVFPLLDETGQQPDPGRLLVQTAKPDKKSAEGRKALKDYLQKVKQNKGNVIGDSSRGTQAVQGGSPAFQLTPYGFPAQEMTAQELVYAVRNRKTYRKYGFSIVEQGLAMIALGLGRQDWQAAWYTSGNCPEMMIFLPPEVPVSKVEEYNGMLDSILTGQLSNRRKALFLPGSGTDGGKNPQVIFPKQSEEVLKDTFDEWLARYFCFVFGMSPTAFIKQVNRATAENMSEQSEEQGLQPYIDWMNDTLNEIIQNQFGFDDIEATTKTREEQDAEKQAAIDQIYVSTGIKTIDEVREQNGDDPFGLPETSQPMIITKTGAVPVSVDHQVEQEQTKISAGVKPDPTAPKEPPGKVPSRTGTEGNGRPPKGGKRAEKAVAAPYYQGATDIDPSDSRHNWPELSPSLLSTKSLSSAARVEVALRKTFRKSKEAAIRGVNGLVARPAEKVLSQMLESLRKDSPEDSSDDQYIDELAGAIYSEAVPYFQELAIELAQPYEDSALSGVQTGALQLNIDDVDLLNSINMQASEWARARAAELVGMKRDLEGNLVPNPDAKWAITDTTRQDLRDIIADSFIGNTNWDDFKTNLKAALESSNTFSDARAAMIARTEIARSQMGSSLDVWKKSGIVTRIQWLATGDDPCPICLENDSVEVALGDAFPSGATSILESHPRCECMVRAIAFAVPAVP